MLAMRRLLTGLLSGLSLALPASVAAETQLVDISPSQPFASPMYMASPPGDSERVFVVERAGTIRIVKNGVRLPDPFLDISAQTQADGEGGLLSMAFSPDYATTGRFYVFFTEIPVAPGNAGADIRVEEFIRSSSDPDRAGPGQRNVLEIEHSTFDNHYGGGLHFGPDGLLYVSVGDGGWSDDPEEDAQDATSPLGKLLRIDARTVGTEPEVYALGLRNPFRFSFDRATGDITIGDVGQDDFEELNFIPTGSAPGKNFGWPCFEGAAINDGAPSGCSAPNATPPTLARPRASNSRSIVAGQTVRDPALGTLAGRHVYADFFDNTLRSACLSATGAVDDRPTPPASSSTVAFGEDSSGRVHVVSLGGTVRRLEGASSVAACPTPAQTSPLASAGNGNQSVLPDITAPRLLTRTPRSQRVLRQRGLVAYARCRNEACNLSTTARLRIGRLSYPLPRVRLALAANRRVRVRAKLTARASRALRRALRRRTPARVDVAFRARDAARNASPLRRAKVRVRR